jgi:signal transduction histidine kinase
MEIAHDFSPTGDSDPVKGRLDQLEQQLALYQQALGHDLPNQMVALQGLARILEQEPGPDAGDLVTRLAVLARRTDENMRTLAKLGRLCRHAGTGERLDLAQLAREAATEAKVLFSGQPLEYHLQEDMPVVVASRALLYQVLLQLLRNAVQAAGERTVAVEIGGRRLETGGVEFWVRDTGRGMTGAQLNQARATLAGEAGAGAGLGLVLVRLAVAGWRGAVHVSSEPGQGTVVKILARTL